MKAESVTFRGRLMAMWAERDLCERCATHLLTVLTRLTMCDAYDAESSASSATMIAMPYTGCSEVIRATHEKNIINRGIYFRLFN